MLRMIDIAAKAGVSQSTVSFVLNGRHTAIRISEETRQKVLHAAEELGYRNNRIAGAVRSGNIRMLGLIGGDLGTEHVGAMMAGVIEEANRCQYSLKPLPDAGEHQTPRDVVRWSSEWRLAGVIALHLPLSLIQDLHYEAKTYEYPLVMLDTRVEGDDLPQVVSDDAAGIRAAIAHLVALGHQRIAYISGASISTLSPLREAFFASAMQENGLQVPAHLVVNGDYRFHAPNQAAARALLELPARLRPTAILCGGDRIAAITMQVAQKRGLRVPDQLSIIGTSNTSIAELLCPTLTTIEQPFRQMGHAAVQRLIQILEPEATFAAQNPFSFREEGSRQLLETRLIVRESTAVAKK